ncbi:hypothetical protein Tco_0925982 [Tanacetum coccineum]|uniref:Uncharacterized protein n=1 Tax=Tanacetum coccineum TaxID=301880 RepID=A0ABQ5DB87_9ASTR
MDDPNITMEEYIRLEEEKAQKRAIAFNNKVSSEKTLSREPTVSSLNDEIDFRISFDDSDDEDYTVIFEKNSFSYKIISTNDLKTDSENDNEKVMPSLPSPEPTFSYLDDLDFFKEFENEFPTIVYNDAQTSKSDLLTEAILSPQHIDEFDLSDETSLSKYKEEEQNVLYFNDLFPFNIIHSDDLKSKKDNDDNNIDIIQSSEDVAPLPLREQRHLFLRYQGLEYTDADIADFEERLERMVMEHRDDAGVVVFTSRAWGRLFDTRGPLVWELILEFLRTLRFSSYMFYYSVEADYVKFQLGGARRRLSWRQFILALGLHTGEEMESLGFARVECWIVCGSIGSAFTAEILRGLTVIAPELPMIDMAELVRLHISQDALVIDDGGQADPAPVQAPPPPPMLA